VPSWKKSRYHCQYQLNSDGTTNSLLGTDTVSRYDKTLRRMRDVPDVSHDPNTALRSDNKEEMRRALGLSLELKEKGNFKRHDRRVDKGAMTLSDTSRGGQEGDLVLVPLCPVASGAIIALLRGSANHINGL